MPNPAEQFDDNAPDVAVPMIRRPVLFYACVLLAFGLLGAAVIALGRQ